MKHLLLTTIAAVVLVGCGTSLYEAAAKGNIEVVKQHLAAGTDVNAKDDKFGTTPLYSAAGAGRKEIVELLIAEGADVNAKGWATGGTPLLIAAMEGHNEVVELLISKGADVDVREYGNGLTPLHFAALGDHKETAELLIAEGADVNAKDVNLRKPAVGRDVQVRRPGKTPLDTAIRRKHPEITDLLRKHGGKTGEELKAEGK
jgi:ankyrin repeat protein